MATMDWQIGSFGRKSSHSGHVFQPAERVISLLHKAPEGGELERADILESEAEAFAPPGPVLGRWRREVKAPEDEASGNEQKRKLQSAEELFLSLFEAPPQEAADDTADALKHVLALLLERKRVLRAEPPRQAEGAQTYRHVKRKETYEVPVVSLSPERMLKIQDTLGDLVF